MAAQYQRRPLSAVDPQVEQLQLAPVAYRKLSEAQQPILQQLDRQLVQARRLQLHRH
jgi:hypothetical protein